MRRLLNAKQMRACDSYTSDYFGVEPVVLMERAALSTYISICNCGKMYLESRVLIICGTGNNGADGLALTRILYESGHNAEYCIPFDSGKHSELFDRQKSILEKYGLFAKGMDDIRDEYDIVIDAMFGIGLSRDLSADITVFIEKINQLDGFKVAMDIPSGVNADNGKIMGCAFRADITVTYGFAKPGLVLYPGKDFCGEVLISNIGITGNSLECLDEEIDPHPVYFMEQEDLLTFLPERPDDGNKGTFGKVLIYAGSDEISGACVLSCLAALKSGTGMVKVITSKENAEVLKNTVPEAMVTCIGDGLNEKLDTDLNWADVVMAGPGIGTGEGAAEVLSNLLVKAPDKPFVIDADGINIIAGNDRLKDMIKERKAVTVLTPHMGELSRLSGKTVKDLKENILSLAAPFASDLGVILVAKDAVTSVTNGKDAVLVHSGNNGMATAGSGDVLAGIISSMLANKAFEREGITQMAAVLCGVYLHGMAGSECLQDMAEDSVTAGDIIISLQRVLKTLRDEQKTGKIKE